MKNIILLFFFCFLFCSCERTCEKKGGHNTFIVENRSDKNIDFKIVEYFTDTIIPFDYNPKTNQNEIIKPHTTFSYWVRLRRGECIEDNYSNGEKGWLYFFDADTISKLSWDIIRLTGRGVLEGRIINLEYLKNNDFRLIYQ